MKLLKILSAVFMIGGAAMGVGGNIVGSKIQEQQIKDQAAVAAAEEVAKQLRGV